MKKLLSFLYKVNLDVLGLLSSPYRWMAILFALWFYRVAYMPADSGGLAKLIQVVTIFGMLILLTRYNKKWLRIVHSSDNSVKFLFLLYSWATLSGLWSPLPEFAFFLGLQNLVLFFIINWIFEKSSSFEDMEKRFVWGGLFLAFINSVLFRIFGQTGLFVHSLDSASTAGMMVCYCIGEYAAIVKDKTGRKAYLRATFLICSLIVILGTSSGANVSTLFGVGVALLLSKKVAYGFPLVMGAGFLLFNQDLLEDFIYFVMPGKTKETLETVTGRQQLWDAMIYLAEQRPWTGWGFGCVERVAWNNGMIPFPVPDAHSNFVGLYGSLGYIGCFLALIHFVSFLIGAFLRRQFKGSLGIFAAGCCALVNGYSYGFLASKTCTITLIYFCIVIFSHYNSKKYKELIYNTN